MMRPLIVTLEYNHDCICSDVPERHPDTSITYLAELGSRGKAISHLFSVGGGDVGRFLDALRGHPTTFDVEVLGKNEGRARIITVTKEDASTRHALNESGCAFITAPIYDGGIEKACLFAPSFDSMGAFLDSLKGSYNIRVTSKRFMRENDEITPEGLVRAGCLDMFSAAGKLTEKQARVLKLAADSGYYDMPQRITLDRIGERMGTSGAAAGELLRKAERKLIPTLAKIVALRR